MPRGQRRVARRYPGTNRVPRDDAKLARARCDFITDELARTARRMRSTRRIRTGNSAGAAQKGRNAQAAYVAAAAIAASRCLRVRPNVVVLHGVWSRPGVTLCA